MIPRRLRRRWLGLENAKIARHHGVQITHPRHTSILEHTDTGVTFHDPAHCARCWLWWSSS